MQFEEPLGIDLPLGLRDIPASLERWIPDERVETTVLPLEDLWELDLPVERCERSLGMPPLVEPRLVALGLSVQDGTRVLAPPALAVLRFLALEECRQHQVAEEPHVAQFGLRRVPHVAQLVVCDRLTRLADVLPQG